MLGLGDIWVFSAYVLCIASTIFCLIYSIMRWNKDGTPASKKDLTWLDEEAKIEEEL